MPLAPVAFPLRPGGSTPSRPARPSVPIGSPVSGGALARAGALAVAVCLAPLLAAGAAAAALPSCARDGDRITATGRLGIARFVSPTDPSHRAQDYLFIAFDPAICVLEPGLPAGEPVAQAEFLTGRPPLKSMLGVLDTYTGSIEHGADAPGETWSFVAY